MGNGSNGKILCIEDEPNTCELFQIVLPEFEIVSANTVAEGIELARNGDYSLIFVDFYLPDGRGDEACIKIRETDQKTPILIVTGSMTFTERRARDIGAQGLLKKNSLTFIDDLQIRAAELASVRASDGHRRNFTSSS